MTAALQAVAAPAMRLTLLRGDPDDATLARWRDFYRTRVASERDASSPTHIPISDVADLLEELLRLRSLECLAAGRGDHWQALLVQLDQTDGPGRWQPMSETPPPHPAHVVYATPRQPAGRGAEIAWDLSTFHRDAATHWLALPPPPATHAVLPWPECGRWIRGKGKGVKGTACRMPDKHVGRHLRVRPVGGRSLCSCDWRWWQASDATVRQHGERGPHHHERCWLWQSEVERARS
jgi:hypothetical protein